MKKHTIALLIAFTLLLIFATSALATKSVYSQGKWSDWQLHDTYASYKLMDGAFVGDVTQPYSNGRNQKAFFEGTVDGISGACWMSVTTFHKNGDPMHGTIQQYDGDLRGLQATFTGTFESEDPFWGYFETNYHFEGK